MKIAMSRSTHILIIAGLGVLAAFAAGSTLGLAQPAAASRPNQVQYAVLTKVGEAKQLPCRNVVFEFVDRSNHYVGENLRTLLKSRLPVAGDDAAIVNAISDLGWELISHSQSTVASNPLINNGTTAESSTMYVNETWWFKRR